MSVESGGDRWRHSGLVWRHRGLAYPLDERLIHLERRINHLDQVGIDVAVLTVAPDLFLYSSHPAETAEICHMVNDDLSQLVKDADGRLYGLASLPLNDPAVAARELRRVSQRPGIVGAAIGTSVNALMLDDPSFDPLYATAAELGMPILLHPHTEGLAELVCAGLDASFLDNVVGNPLETCRAAARLITGGVFDRHPTLHVQLVHGGGHFPYQLGRMEHAFEVDELARGMARKAPSEYLGQLLFDTVVFRARALDFLVDAVGASQVTFGTDLPFTMADLSALHATDREWSEDVLGRNAVRVYRLPPRR